MGKAYLRFGSEDTDFESGITLDQAWADNAADISGDPSKAVTFRSNGADVDGSAIAQEDRVYVVALKGEVKGH